MAKTIGIIVAMDKELSLFVDNENTTKEIKLGGFDFYIRNTENSLLIIAKSGIGKVNSALCTASMIENYHPDYILSSGVCGSVRESGIMPGDIIVADKVKYWDVDCGEPNKLGQVQEMPEYFDCLDVPEEFFTDYDNTEISIIRGLIVTGDKFIQKRAVALMLRAFNSDGVDMESASIAQTCYRFKVPFLSIRIVSDAILNPLCKEKTYKGFWEKAPVELHDIVLNLIKKIS